MKRKELDVIKHDEVTSLAKKSDELKKQLAMLIAELSTSPQKDSNMIGKKKRELATILTIMREKKIYVKTA